MKNVYGIFEKTPTIKLPKGQVLIHEGDTIEDLYYIRDGYIKVYNILDSGSENIIFVYGPGDVLPFTTYLSSDITASYFYECMTDVALHGMPTKEFEQSIKGNVLAGEALIVYTTQIGWQFIQRIDVLSVNDARRKVIALLAFLVEKTGSKGPRSRLDIPLTTQDMAGMCALTRETTSTQLVRLRRKGVISGTRNLVINNNALSEIKTELTILP